MIKQLPTFEIMTITPAMAKTWLEESNFENRRLDDYRVNKIAHDIKNGKWIFDGTPIRFNGGGNILDGQHRLSAIIKANKPIESMVFKGLESDSKNTIDTGKSRSIGDILNFNGYINCTSLAAAARLAIGYREFKGDLSAWERSRDSGSISPQEILTECQRNALLIKSTQHVISLKYIKKMVGSGVPIFCYFLFSKNTSVSLAEIFFQKLEKGSDLGANSPILKLRNELMLRDTKRYLSGKRASVYNAALFIKAWNAWVAKKPVEMLKYAPDEEYPKIVK